MLAYRMFQAGAKASLQELIPLVRTKARCWSESAHAGLNLPIC